MDKRADIWAFGVVLYEMLAGKAAFTGESTSDILAAVLRSEPDWSALPAEDSAADPEADTQVSGARSQAEAAGYRRGAHCDQRARGSNGPTGRTRHIPLALATTTAVGCRSAGDSGRLRRPLALVGRAATRATPRDAVDDDAAPRQPIPDCDSVAGRFSSCLFGVDIRDFHAGRRAPARSARNQTASCLRIR